MSVQKQSLPRRERPTKRADSNQENLAIIMQEGRLGQKLASYLQLCHGENSSEESFPNLAGFCRYLGVGVREFSHLGEQYPRLYDQVMTSLEDEALNARRLPANSASLTAAYFKRRLGYDGEDTEVRAGEWKVVFDHDIEEAGI